jgi:hypothetical protein
VREAAGLLGKSPATFRRRHRDQLLADVADGLWQYGLGRSRQTDPTATTGTGLSLPTILAAPSGVTLSTLDFYRGIPWAELISRASEIDIFFTYGRTWRHTLTAELAALGERLDVKVRVVLPSTKSPRDTALPEIAKRAGQPIDRLVSNIDEARRFFEDLCADIWLVDMAQLYAAYRFDDQVVVSMYNHRHGQTEGVPTILCQRGGSFFEFFSEDFQALIGRPGQRGLAIPHRYRPKHRRASHKELE